MWSGRRAPLSEIRQGLTLSGRETLSRPGCSRASAAGQRPRRRSTRPRGAAATLALVIAIEKKFSERVDRCDTTLSGEKYNRCISDALKAYAGDLGGKKVILPPELEDIPDIISEAASEVRSAHRSVQPPAPDTAQPGASRGIAIEGARSAVAAAAVEIRKDIALLEATEETAEVQAIQVRTGDVIAVSLERLEGKLLQATTI